MGGRQARLTDSSLSKLRSLVDTIRLSTLTVALCNVDNYGSGCTAYFDCPARLHMPLSSSVTQASRTPSGDATKPNKCSNRGSGLRPSQNMQTTFHRHRASRSGCPEDRPLRAYTGPITFQPTTAGEPELDGSSRPNRCQPEVRELQAGSCLSCWADV